MQTYQMAMLLLFESINQMTCKEMQVWHMNVHKSVVDPLYDSINARKRFN